MARYIDAERFFDDFTELRDYEYASNEYNADVVPVVHAHWIHPFSNDIVQCSNCENYFQDKVNVHSVVYHYCPNCGAKMDEEASV